MLTRIESALIMKAKTNASITNVISQILSDLVEPPFKADFHVFQNKLHSIKTHFIDLELQLNEAEPSDKITLLETSLQSVFSILFEEEGSKFSVINNFLTTLKTKNLSKTPLKPLKEIITESPKSQSLRITSEKKALIEKKPNTTRNPPLKPLKSQRKSSENIENKENENEINYPESNKPLLLQKPPISHTPLPKMRCYGDDNEYEEDLNEENLEEPEEIELFEKKKSRDTRKKDDDYEPCTSRKRKAALPLKKPILTGKKIKKEMVNKREMKEYMEMAQNSINYDVFF